MRAKALAGSFVTAWPAQAPHHSLFLCPIMQGLPRKSASVLALRPIGDCNARLFEAMKSHADAAPSLCAAIFAVDPFVRLDDMIQRCRESGIRELINWPSVGLFDGAFQDELNAKGLGYERELNFVAAAAREGFALTATVFNAEQGRKMIEAGARRLLFHPPLAGSGPLPADAAIEWLAPIARKLAAGARILVYVEDDGSDRLTLPSSIGGLVTWAGSGTDASDPYRFNL